LTLLSGTDDALDADAPQPKARAPVRGYLGYVVGTLELGAALLLAAWFLFPSMEAAESVLRRSPIELPGTPAQLAYIVVQQEVLWGVAIAAIALLVFSFESFRLARPSLRPANESDNGKLRLDLTAPARLGRWLEGEAALLKGGREGENYHVRLRCSRRVYEPAASADEDSSYRDDVKYEQRVRTKAVSTGAGLAVRFRFEIPIGMPASGVGGFAWTLEVGRPRALFPARFPVEMKALARGEALPAGAPVSDILSRDWTHVEPTKREARIEARMDRVMSATSSPAAGWIILVALAAFVVVGISGVVLGW
jgi:hypothetical protein